MQLTKNDKAFNTKKVEQLISSENKFISDLFATLSLPTRIDEDSENEDGAQNEDHSVPNPKKEKTRASSLTELQERIEAITSKKKLTYKEKVTKKNLKNRIKKKSKQDERNAQQKLIRAQKTIKADPESEATNGVNGHVKTAKPVFNSEGKMVFSKFDFSGLGARKEKKKENDPKKLLENLEKQKELLEELEERGEIGKAVEIKEKAAWKNALAKAEGAKVKDDPTLLKKTVQRHEQQKRSSKKKWEARKSGVEKAKDDRQKKRSDNIEKRKKDKKKSKLKKAVKRGKIIPGF